MISKTNVIILRESFKSLGSSFDKLISGGIMLVFSKLWYKLFLTLILGFVGRDQLSESFDV